MTEGGQRQTQSRFQSTPPWEGATINRIPEIRILSVSIHAPVGGGDTGGGLNEAYVALFQSTPPWEGATWQDLFDGIDEMFQSTPPWEGATLLCQAVCAYCSCFNPRPRGRGRRQPVNPWPQPDGFQSTPPWEGATSFRKFQHRSAWFQSTPPWEGATIVLDPLVRIPGFQSTPPWEGATRDCLLDRPRRGCFNPRPRGRGRLCLFYTGQQGLLFQSTPPWEGATRPYPRAAGQ